MTVGGKDEMGEKLTVEELKELMELYKIARTTPVIALSVADGIAGKDFASQAYKRFEDRWAEIAKYHGAHPSDGFNSKTGEIIVNRS